MSTPPNAAEVERAIAVLELPWHEAVQMRIYYAWARTKANLTVRLVWWVLVGAGGQCSAGVHGLCAAGAGLCHRRSVVTRKMLLGLTLLIPPASAVLMIMFSFPGMTGREAFWVWAGISVFLWFVLAGVAIITWKPSGESHAK